MRTLTGDGRSPCSGGRVALLFASFSGGGVERSMLRLGQAFTARGLAVDVVIGQAKGELRTEAPAGAQVIELGKTSLWRAAAAGLAVEPRASRLLFQPHTLKRLWRRLPALVRYLNEARPNALVAAEPRYNAMAAWALRRSRLQCRLVLSEHIQASSHASLANPWADPRVLPLLRRAYLTADAIVTASRGVADDLAAYTRIPRHRITTIYNPVVARDLLVQAREPVDHPWFAPGEPPVVLGVGRLQPQKDFATLLRAFAKLRSRRSARLVILGSDLGSAHAAALQALAKELGVADAVDLPGFVANPLAWMSRAAVFVLSSRYEGLGNALIEALACGTPVVSTDCPSGPREILDDGRFGPLVPVGDAAALADAIEQVFQDPLPAESLRARAQLFSVERAADAYLELLFSSRREAALRS